MLGEKFGHFCLNRLRQQGTRSVAQHLGERVSERPWLKQLDHGSIGHGVSLLRWRSGGANTPTIRRLLPLSPSPTSAHNSAGTASMLCGDGTPWGDWLGAWDLWWTGEEARQCLLLGSKILWWGRAGKVAQLIAGMAIVVEILGPEWFVRRGSGIEERTKKYVKDAETVFPQRL